MLLSFKTRLEPNNKQRTAFRKAAGTARHAYNWGNTLIRDILKLRQTDKSVKVPSAIDLHKRLIAQVKPENPWYYQTNKNVPQKALADLRTAWKRCFSKVSAQALVVPDGGEFHRDCLWSGQTLLSPEISHDETESKHHRCPDS